MHPWKKIRFGKLKSKNYERLTPEQRRLYNESLKKLGRMIDEDQQEHRFFEQGEDFKVMPVDI